MDAGGVKSILGIHGFLCPRVEFLMQVTEPMVLGG